MLGFIFNVFMSVLFSVISVSVTLEELKSRCVDANPTVSSSEIEKFCEKRLYLKEQND